MLADEGVVLLKFWIHLSKAEQKQRLEALDSDPRTSWRVTEADWRAYRLYSKSHDLWEHLLRESSTAEAPWYVVEGARRALSQSHGGQDPARRDAGGRRGASRPRRGARAPPTSPAVIDNLKLIRSLDLTKKLSHERLRDRRSRNFRASSPSCRATSASRDHSLVLVFEGIDAAGKGGAIRRVTGALDARQYVTVPIAAPTEEERAQPYLWRFWRNVPPQGRHHDLRSLLVRPRAGRARRGLLPRRRLDARLRRDQRLRGAARASRARSSSSSGCRSARKSSCGASRSARQTPSSASRSRRTTGATARSGTTTSSRSATWSTARAPRSRRGRWSRRTTSTSRASRSCAPSSTGWSAC